MTTASIQIRKSHSEGWNVPPSPTWAPYADTSVQDMPTGFKWRALYVRVGTYPNTDRKLDQEDTDEFQETFHDEVSCWRKQCRCMFGTCPWGRQTLSKNQRKQELGVAFSPSLCGQSKLDHLVTEKRAKHDTTPSEDICDWYYSSDDDEDDEESTELYDEMQLRRTNSGTLQFSKPYIMLLENGVDVY